MEQKISKLAKVVATEARKVTKKATVLFEPNVAETFQDKAKSIYVEIKKIDDTDRIYFDIIVEFKNPKDAETLDFQDQGYVSTNDINKTWDTYNNIKEYLEDTDVYYESNPYKFYNKYVKYAIEQMVDIADGKPILKKTANRNNRVTKKAKEEIEPGEIYEKAKAVLPKEDIDHHASDLYLRVSPKSTELVNSMKYRNNGMITTFKDNIEGDMWYELPFCYPYISELMDKNKKSSKKQRFSKKAWDGEDVEDNDEEINEYDVPVKITFRGNVYCKATSQDDANSIVVNNFGALLGRCEDNSDGEIVDWDIETHGDTDLDEENKVSSKKTKLSKKAEEGEEYKNKLYELIDNGDDIKWLAENLVAYMDENEAKNFCKKYGIQ